VYVGIMDGEGKRLYQKRLPTDIEIILKALEPYQDRLEALAVEATYNWYWLVDGLQEAGYAVRLANPARMQKYEALKVTNDRSDAFWLAEQLRLGVLPEGYIYPKWIRPVRDMLRRRMLIVRQRTQMLLSLQTMTEQIKAARISAWRLKSWDLEEIKARFDDPYTVQTLWAMVQLIRKQDILARSLEDKVLEHVRLFDPYDRLLTLPGVGRILGITIMLETGPIGRFATAGQYASYCRTVPSRRESNQKKKGENNRKNGNRYLGWAYVEAANFAQRYDPVVRRWFQRKLVRSCRVVAIKALACKLSKAAYYILRDGVEYEPRMLFG